MLLVVGIVIVGSFNPAAPLGLTWISRKNILKFQAGTGLIY